MAKPDKPFWNWVTERCIATGQTEARLAGRLGVSPQTLSSWKARNQFRSDLLVKLAKELKEPPLSVAKAHKLKVELIVPQQRAVEVKRPPIEVALRNANSAYRRMEKTFVRYSTYTMPLIRALDRNCFYAFSSCTTSPYEFETIQPGEALAEEMTKALFRGARLLYIRPTQEGMAYYEKQWGYGRVVRFEDAQDEIRKFRSFVETKLVSGDAGPELKMDPLQAKEWLHERLSQCYIPHSPMWMPGVGLGMVGWAHARDLKARMTMSLPGGRFGGILVYPQYYALEYRFGRVLRAVVTRALQILDQLRAGHPCDKSVQFPHLKGSSDPMLPRTATFYRALDQMLRTVSSHDAPENALDRAPPSDPFDE